MKNLPFVIWMIGWPMACEYIGYTYLIINFRFESYVTIDSILPGIIWIAIAFLVYEKKR